MITIFTPTYNRAHTLERLYQSLCRQASFDFEWLIVDDGSTDNTKDLFQSIKEYRFDVRYYYQLNGGKHRAINRAVELAKGEWFFIVDSDDYLTDDAITFLNIHLEDIESQSQYCGIVLLRITPDHRTIGTPCTYDTLDTDLISYQTKYMNKGDRAEVIRISIMKDYPFPEIENEKFCTEAVVWNRIAQKYIARYINKGIYVCEYLLGGLTDNYQRIMDESPYYSMIYYKDLVSYDQISFLQKIRYLVWYFHYCKIAKFRLIKEIYPSLQMFFLFPLLIPAYIIRFFYKRVK